MSKLVVNIGTNHLLESGSSISIVLPTLYGDRVAQTVLLARRAGQLSLAYVASGKLQINQTGAAKISGIEIFPREIQAFQMGTAEAFEISDEEFDDVIADVVRAQGASEVLQAPFAPPPTLTSQLADSRRHRCDFSGIRTYNGTSVSIRPRHTESQLTAKDVLFLDPEPGALFASFAWTVGPRYEIIIDAHAMTADIADTVNRTGLLALPENMALWPDRDALAWHFDQFTRRITSGR